MRERALSGWDIVLSLSPGSDEIESIFWVGYSLVIVPRV